MPEKHRQPAIESIESLTLLSASVDGTEISELIDGSEGDTTISAGGGDDLIFDAFGTNVIDGGDGHDILAVEGLFADFSITPEGDQLTIEGEGIYGHVKYITENVEQLNFVDREVLTADLGYGENRESEPGVPEYDDE